jgi:hypothetical protein
MPAELYAPPVPPIDRIDEFMTDSYVTEQIAFMEQREFAATPLEAHYIGHSATSTTVEIGREATGRPPEAGASEAAAEIWKTFSPFRAENAPIFGSEEARLAAVESVRGIARQAQLTNRYLNGAHKRASRQLAAGEITQDQHDETVGQIAATLSLTSPLHLQNVGEAQRNALARRKKAGLVGEDVQYVDLTSRRTENGVELAGIDAVVAQMTGARSRQELNTNGLRLKRENYRDADALTKAIARHEAQQTELQVKQAAIVAERTEIARTINLIDEDDKAKAKRDK